MKSVCTLITALLLLPSIAAAGFVGEPVAEGIEFPVAIAFDSDGRLFFTERYSGQVRLIGEATSEHPRLLPRPVYRFGPISGYFERGLLGLALDPDFKTNGYLYVYYSHRGSDPKTDPYRHRLMRITVREDVGEDPVALLDHLPIGSPSEAGKGNHNGGSLAFGPDRKLYLTIGDIAIPRTAPDLDSFAGKILRLNPDGSAPSDNPFYDPKQPSAPRSYVFALGLRNSFDFTFESGPPGRARLFATENGPATNDELNIIEMGKNYGWGEDQVSGIRNQKGLVDPILVYRRTIAPTGIAFYSGNRYPDRYRGKLIFADWNTGRIRMVKLSEKDPALIVSVDEEIYRHREGIVDLVSGPDGRLYFTSPNGIYRLNDDESP